MAPIAFISSPPRSISPAEHRQLVASTPVSFNDIPPVLRHKEESVAIALDPPLEGFSAEDCAKGILYVTESVLAFLSETGKGVQIEYPTITLHAIARGEAGPTIYCQLDEASAGQGNDSGGNEADEAQDMRELKLIPADPASLEPIFEALSLCAALHPDPQESDDDMDDAFVDAAEGGGFETFTGDEAQELSEVGRASLAYLESIIDDPRNLTSQPQEEAKNPQDPPTKINGTHD